MLFITFVNCVMGFMNRAAARRPAPGDLGYTLRVAERE